MAKERHSKNFNAVPDGWREITEKEFAKGPFFMECAEFYEFRQFHPSPVKDATDKHWLLDAKLWFYHAGHGVGMMHDFWAEKVRYFAFGCDHDYKHAGNEGRCLNRYKCEKCGDVMVLDSSD